MSERLSQHPGTIPLIASQSLASFNDNAIRSAFAALLLIHSPHNVLYSALGGLLLVLPSVLCPPSGARLCDAYGLRLVLSGCKLVEIIAVLIGLCGFYLNSVPPVFVSILFLGFQISFSTPARYSSIPLLLPERLWMRGNAILESIGFVGILLGTLFGSAIANTTHPLFWLISVTILCSALGAISVLFLPKNHKPTQTHPQKYAMPWCDLKTAFRIKGMNILMFGNAWFWTLGLSVMVLLPDLVNTHLHGINSLLTGLLALFIFGMGLGAMLSPKIVPLLGGFKRTPLILILMSLFLVMLGHVHHPEGAAIAITVSAFCAGIFSIPLMTEIQERCSDAERTRVIGVGASTSSAMMVLISAFIAGIDALHISSGYILMGIAALNIAFAGFGLISLPSLFTYSGRKNLDTQKSL